jgi:hypothetical protein
MNVDLNITETIAVGLSMFVMLLVLSGAIIVSFMTFLYLLSQLLA